MVHGLIWGTLINANKYEQRSGTRRVYDPTICREGGRGPAPVLYAYAAEGTIITHFEDGGENCDPFRYESFSYVAKIPLKNDGVTTPDHSTWNKNDALYSNSDNNFYYDDPGDGGYNHLELARYKRTYTEGANRKGDLAIPMRQTEIWLKNVVLN